jgi:hypothetical protein
MPNYAIIENGKVINTVVATANYAAKKGWIALTNGGIDWHYVDGQFIDNRPVPEKIMLPTPTKDEILLELQTLTAKINAMSEPSNGEN